MIIAGRTLKLSYVIGVVLVVLLASGCSFLFGQGEDVVEPEPEVSNVLAISAPAHVYAHLFRSFPEVDGDEIVVDARLRPTSGSGSSWVTSLVLYWEDNWAIGIGQQVGAITRTLGVGIGNVTSRMDDTVDPDLEWIDVRIRLTSTDMEMLVKGEGDWVSVKSVSRPEVMAGLPAQILVGKGYSGSNEHLDNSNEEPGGVGLSYVDDVVVWVDGVKVLHEEFDDLSNWDWHGDPEYDDRISFEIVSSSEI